MSPAAESADTATRDRSAAGVRDARDDIIRANLSLRPAPMILAGICGGLGVAAFAQALDDQAIAADWPPECTAALRAAHEGYQRRHEPPSGAEQALLDTDQVRDNGAGLADSTGAGWSALDGRDEMAWGAGYRRGVTVGAWLVRRWSASSTMSEPAEVAAPSIASPDAVAGVRP